MEKCRVVSPTYSPHMFLKSVVLFLKYQHVCYYPDLLAISYQHCNKILFHRSIQVFGKQGTNNVRSHSHISCRESTTFPSEVNMRRVEFSLINANQKIDKSVVCRFSKAILGQGRPLILQSNSQLCYCL